MGTSDEQPFKSLSDPVINQAVADLANHYSTVHFRFAIDEIRKVVALVIAEDLRTDQQRARYRILRYLDLYLKRARQWAEDESDLMANVMRGSIELRFW